jgi:microcompartment protein CcmL/EutN
MVKKAAVRLVESRPVSPGKYIVVLAGLEADVQEALQAGVEVAGVAALDRMLLANAHPDLLPAVAGALDAAPIDAVGVIECFSVAATLSAADAAAKAADVRLLEIRLANGLGGKGFLTLTGAQDAVEAAVAAGGAAAAERGMLADTVVIPAPHQDLKRKLQW